MCVGLNLTLLNSLNYFKHAWIFRMEQLYKTEIYRLKVTNNMKFLLAHAITTDKISN